MYSVWLYSDDGRFQKVIVLLTSIRIITGADFSRAIAYRTYFAHPSLLYQGINRPAVAFDT